MTGKPFICTEGLRRRTVSPNEHQTKRLQQGGQVLTSRYYDGLAALLCKAIADDDDRRQRANDDGPPCTVTTTAVYGGVRTEDDVGVAVKKAAVQTTSSERCWEDDADTSTTDDESCVVDLKAVSKLRKLCLLLKTNVSELRTVYGKKCDMGYVYEERERCRLETELRALEADVSRLFDAVYGMTGFRDEVKAAVKTYTDHEARYRVFRTLNKRAKFRNKSAAASDSAGPVAAMCQLFRKYLIDPCYGWTSARSRSSGKRAGGTRADEGTRPRPEKSRPFKTPACP